VKKGSLWPWIIAGALALHVVASLVVVFMATSNPSYAVEEDYYQKALHWNNKRAQDRTNEELGWVLDLEVHPAATQGGEPNLEVRLADAGGEPVDGAVVAVETFHNARANDILRASLDPVGEGVYRTTLPMRHNGRWEVRFTVTRGVERFTHSETRHLFVQRGRR
jgi:hypothetical protein